VQNIVRQIALILPRKVQYDFLVDHKVLLRQVSCLEEITDKWAKIKTANYEQEKSPDGQPADQSDHVYVPVEYTKTLEKAYRWPHTEHTEHQVPPNAKCFWLCLYSCISIAINE